MGDTTQDFDRLQSAAQQSAPQHHNHHAGAIAAVGTMAVLAAHQAKQRAEVANGTRPQGLKGSVLGWWLALGFVVHNVLTALMLPDDVTNHGWATWWLLSIPVWVVTWAVGLYHQDKVSTHNKALWDSFN